MRQNPTFSRAEVKRIIIRDFGASSSNGIWKILDLNGRESWQKEVSRVQMAALKCCERNVQRLKKLIEVACRDYRDVLSWAEYPGYGALGFVEIDKLSGEERRELQRRDSEQYWEWVRR